jgi:hypothetical protein
MFIFVLLLVSLLCLLFQTTRLIGIVMLIVLCLIFPVLLVVLMAIGLGIYLFNRSNHKQLLLPKE